MINGTGLKSIQHVALGSMPHVEYKLIRTHRLTIFEATSLTYAWLHRESGKYRWMTEKLTGSRSRTYDSIL